jgi:hypothetical protein
MIPYLQGEVVTIQTQRLILEVRNTFFTSPQGKSVWARIHSRLGTFDSGLPDSAETAAFRALGQELYEWAGVNHQLNEALIHEQLMKIPPFYTVDDGSKNEEGETQ